MQIPNAWGFAKYKSVTDTPSGFSGEEFVLIFSTFPCFLCFFREKKNGSEVKCCAQDSTLLTNQILQKLGSCQVKLS